MSRDKDRLLLALYARPKYPDTYHYALMTCPKEHRKKFAIKGSERPMFRKYHVKNTIQSVEGQHVQPWVYESLMVHRSSEPGLLVFIVVAKVLEPLLVERNLEDVPIYQIDTERGSTFDCVEWVRLALESLQSADIVTKIAEWDKVKEHSIKFVTEKKREGHWDTSRGGKWDATIPELDLTKILKITS